MERKGLHGDRIPYFDQSAINYTPSQFASSYAGSMSGAGKQGVQREDDEHTKASFYTSYTAATADSERMVRKESGRDFNVLSETYSLPTDIDEWDRLDKQHRAITLSLGDLYPAPEVVRAVLAPQEGIKKKIVDLGCGTGIWTTEMAREFPHCEVLGLDLAPVPLPPESFPPNCQFEMDDISRGLEHLQGQFDVVFARAIGLGLKDFRKSLADIAGCAKPGGIVIWVDGDLDIRSGWPMTYRPFWSSSNPNGSYLTRVIYELRRIATLGSSDVKTMEKVIDEGFWNNSPLIDPNTCKTASLYLPIGPWCEVGDPFQREKVKYVGMLMRQDFIEFSKTVQPALLKGGWSQETTERWLNKMREECQKDTMGIRVRLAWGRRREGPDLPAPPLSPVTSATSAENEGQTKYPLYEVYDTPEQALEQSQIRNKGKDICPPPLPNQSNE